MEVAAGAAARVDLSPAAAQVVQVADRTAEADQPAAAPEVPGAVAVEAAVEGEAGPAAGCPSRCSVIWIG